MILLFTVKEKTFISKTFDNETDPLGGNEGIEIAVMQRYTCIWSIPYGGTHKMAKAYSIGTGHQIPVLLWTQTMKQQADMMISSVSGAWKNRIVGQIVLLALAVFIGWLLFIGFSNVNTKGHQAEYIEDPAVGDIILAKVIVSQYNDSNMPSSLKILRIEEIRGDSLVVVRGYQSEDTMEQYRIKDKSKLIGLFDTSPNAFANTREVYSLSKYREGNERLQRIRREGLTGDESRRQDSILRHTDIIEPIYVKRTKK